MSLVPSSPPAPVRRSPVLVRFLFEFVELLATLHLVAWFGLRATLVQRFFSFVPAYVVYLHELTTPFLVSRRANRARLTLLAYVLTPLLIVLSWELSLSLFGTTKFTRDLPLVLVGLATTANHLVLLARVPSLLRALWGTSLLRTEVRVAENLYWVRPRYALRPALFLLLAFAPFVAAGDPPAQDFAEIVCTVGTVFLGHRAGKRLRVEDSPREYTPTTFSDRVITAPALTAPPVIATAGYATAEHTHVPDSAYASDGRPYHPKFLFLAARSPSLKLHAARQLCFADQHPSVSIKAYDYVSAALAIELGLHRMSKQHGDALPQRLISAGNKLSNALRSTAM